MLTNSPTADHNALSMYTPNTTLTAFCILTRNKTYGAKNEPILPTAEHDPTPTFLLDRKRDKI